MRVFKMVRDVDVTGISGTGVVATGVEFDDGTVVIRWQGERPSTVVWASMSDAEAIHGHDGKTRFVTVGQPLGHPSHHGWRGGLDPNRSWDDVYT